MNEEMRASFHNLNNTLGAVILNLEEAVAADTGAVAARESAQAALAAALELRTGLVALRQDINGAQ